MKQWDEVGGRSDVYLASDLPDLGRWRIDELPLLEASEIGGEREFPTVGTFAVATELETGRQIYVQITEQLRDFIDDGRGEEPVNQVGVDVDTAEKGGDEETSPWHYTGTVSPLGPPEDGA